MVAIKILFLFIFISFYYLLYCRPGEFILDGDDSQMLCGTPSSLAPDESSIRQQELRLTAQNIVLELGVFYDDAFFTYHQDENTQGKLEFMIEVLIRQAQIVFEYPNLIHRVQLLINQITRMRVTDVPDDVLIPRYLNAFCEWQFNNAMFSSAGRPAYDLAVLFTGNSLYRFGKLNF